METQTQNNPKNLLHPISKDWFYQHRLFIATLVLIIVGAGLIFQGQLDHQRALIKTDFPVHHANVSPTQDASDWKTYTNDQYGFQFIYPGNWSIKEASTEEQATGQIVYLQSPAGGSPGYSNDLDVLYWKDINNEYAKGGSWLGERQYKDLADLFSDKQSLKVKTGEIVVDNIKAYEVVNGGMGQNYGVMLEHDGIYELSFETAWDKKSLSSDQKRILDSFKFIK